MCIFFSFSEENKGCIRKRSIFLKALCFSPNLIENIPTLFLSFVSSLENIISNFEIWFNAQSPALISSKEEPIQIVFLHVVFPNSGLFIYQRLNNKVLCRWDFCFQRASVVEHLDGHTDIVHKLLNNDWLPWSDPNRQTLLQMSIMPSYNNHENALWTSYLKNIVLQGHETKRPTGAAILEKGGGWNIW